MTEARTRESPHFGVAPYIVGKLFQVFAASPGLRAVWIYGSRARGEQRVESDIDLALDAPDFSPAQFSALRGRLDDLELIYRLDVVHLQGVTSPELRQRIERDRQLFWPRHGTGEPHGRVV